MPKIASILSHTNTFAPSVDSDTIRGGFLSVRATSSGLAGEFDPDAPLQSNGNKQDLIKEKGTVVYVTDQSNYYILNDKSNSDIAPEQAGSGWITLLSAIGGQASSSVVTDAHSGISAASSSGNSGLTYIQDLTIDSNGHVTGIGTNTITKADLDLDHLFTLVGAAADTSDNLGTFTGSTLTDNITIRAALQELETAVEAATGTALSGLTDTDIATPEGGHILVYDGTNSFDNVAVSGDITLTSAGVAAIATGVIVDDDIASGAAIATSKLASNTISGVALGGTLGALSAAANGGILVSSYTGASAVSDLQLDIDGMTDINAAIVDTDLFIVDDGANGTNRKTEASRIKSYVIAGITNADAHDGITGATDVDESGLTFIQDVTMDTYGHVTALGTATVTKESLDIDHLITLTGVPAVSDHLGTFTGSTIADNSTIKAALQALETQVDTNSSNTGSTDLSQTTAAGSLTVVSSTGNNVTLQNASATLAGIITAEAQTIAGNKTFNDDVTIAGNLTVTGAATYVNIQEENVYIKDALITLGITDADAGTIDGTAAASDVGIEAYKQGHDGSVSPTLTYDIDQDYWSVHNKDHAASTQNKIAEKFTATVTAASTNVLTHNLNTRDVIVQARVASSEELVIVKYVCNSDQQTTVYFGSGTVGTNVDVVIIG